MEDNTRLHRARVVEEFRQREVVETSQMPDMNPIEHVRYFYRRKVNQRNPQCKIIAELTNAILEE